MDVLYLHGQGARQYALKEWLSDEGYLDGAVTERFESPFDHPIDDDRPHAEPYNEFFETHLEVALEFFPDSDPASDAGITVDREQLNDDRVRDYVRDVDPDLTIAWGVGILEPATIEAVPSPIWNLHDGLTPRYRGMMTHFWPSYHLEPQWTGMTLHELTPELDRGPIVHQSTAPLVRGDGLAELTCRCASSFVENDFPRVLSLFEDGDLEASQSQDSDGRLWRASDFRPEHVGTFERMVDDPIVTAYLNGDLGNQQQPDVVRQFD